MKASVIVIARRKKELGDVLKDLDRQEYDDFEVVPLFGSMSIPRAWNLGVKRALGEIILFTESDCRLPPNWVGDMVSNVEKHGFAMGSEVITTSRAWSMGSVGMLAKECKSLPFDEHFTVCEDTDWFERVRKRGFKLRRQKRPIIFHKKKRPGLRHLKWAFLQGMFRTRIMYKYDSPDMDFFRIVGSRIFYLLLELLMILGTFVGLIRYVYLLPRKISYFFRR